MNNETCITTLIVERLKTLPPMPPNVERLRQAVADPDVNYNRIVPILKEDPSLCADILKIANSARFGVGHKVETVEEGVRYFGITTLVEFLAVACSEGIIRKTFSNFRNLNDFLMHSRHVALGASILAKLLNVNPHDQDVYSVIGLLHDIGRLLIMLVAEKKQIDNEFVELDWETIHNLTKDENRLYGINHAMLGMKICQKWNFPPQICRGVHHHHNPVFGDSISFEGMIIFLSEIVTFTDLPDSILEKALPPEVMQKMNIDSSLLLKAREEFAIHAAEE